MRRAIALGLLAACSHHSSPASGDGGPDSGPADAPGIDAPACPGSCACVVLATEQPRISAIVTDAHHVYWVNFGSSAAGFTDGSVMQASRDGGAPIELASAQAGPRAIAVDSGHVYWANIGTEPGTGSVMSVPIGGGQVAMLASSQPAPAAITVQGDTLYWVNEGTPPANSDGAVMELALPSGAATPFVTPINNPFGVAADANNVYWTSNQDDTVMSVPIGGGSHTMIASGQDNIYQVVIAGVDAYWWAYSYTNSASIHYMMSAPISGVGPAAPIASGVLAGAIATDQSALYWADNSDGWIQSLPIPGAGMPTTICDGQSNPQSVGVDDRDVYWGTVGDGSDNEHGSLRAHAK